MSDMYFQNLPNTSTPITAENLNKLNDIKVSSTQPSTGEKAWFKSGKNLFNKNTALSGSRLDGEGYLFPDSSYSTSAFIPVEPNTQYVTNWNLEIKECVCYYQKDKSFISRNINTNAFTTPNNCKWIRISRATSNINSTQVERGTTSSSYEAYIEKQIYLKNSNNLYEGFDATRTLMVEDNTVKRAKLTWGTTMKFEMLSGQHALVMIGVTDCVMIWMAGDGMQFARIYGNGVNVVVSGNVIAITRTNNANFTGNAIIS